MAKYLLDTTILIEHLRGRKEAVDLLTTLARQGHRLGLCCINVAELYSGLSHEERARADRLIDSLDFYDVTQEVAKQAGQYRYDFARRGALYPLPILWSLPQPSPKAPPWSRPTPRTFP